MDLLIDKLYFYSQINLMPILSILSVLFTQDTCATGSSILTCEIRKEVFLHGYKSARALRKTNTARISKVIYVGIARKVSLFHVGTCRVSGLQNIFFYSHMKAPLYTLLTLLPKHIYNPITANGVLAIFTFQLDNTKR